MGARQSSRFSDIQARQEGHLPPIPRRRRLRRLHRLLFGRSRDEDTRASPTKLGRKVRKYFGRSSNEAAVVDAPAPSPTCTAAPPIPSPHSHPEILLPTPPVPGLSTSTPDLRPRVDHAQDEDQDWDRTSPIPILDPDCPRWSSTPVPLILLHRVPLEVQIKRAPSGRELADEQPTSPICLGCPPADVPVDRWALEDVDSVDMEVYLCCQQSESGSTNGSDDQDPWVLEDDDSVDRELYLCCQASESGSTSSDLNLEQCDRDFEMSNHLADSNSPWPVPSPAGPEDTAECGAQFNGTEQEKNSKRKGKGPKKPTKTKVKVFKKKPRGPATRAVKNLIRKVHPKRRCSNGGEVFSTGTKVVSAPVVVDVQDGLPGMVP